MGSSAAGQDEMRHCGRHVDGARSRLARDLGRDAASRRARTGMTREQGALEPDESASGLLRRIHGLRLQTSGRFLHEDGSILP
jgi:hypothetical protein